MVAPKFRSRRFRRIHVKTPGGKNVLHYKRRKPGRAQCGICGQYLKGVFSGTLSSVSKLSKSERIPQRPYGGVLCTRCMRKVMIEKARKMAV